MSRMLYIATKHNDLNLLINSTQNPHITSLQQDLLTGVEEIAQH